MSGLLTEAWAALGGAPGELERVRLDGDPTGLLTAGRLPALTAMTAAVSAATLAAAVLDAARGGDRAAPVVVGVEAVALAARSEQYATQVGVPPADLFAPLSRFWAAADGWIRLHGNYPWHRDRALQVLGCTEDRAAVAAAIRQWPATELEDALAGAGALGYAVRTSEQWAAHPQGRAVLAGPLVGLDPSGASTRPLGPGRFADGLRVLDLTRVIAGPVGTRTLAAWGADVLRLDTPHLPEIAGQARDTLPGKRSAQLDLATTAGRAAAEQLLARADVLVQGYRPGALARFGLAPGDLAQRHPHLTVVSLSAWGPTGPWAQRRGFDSLVQAPTGIAVLEGRDGAPGALPAQVLDHATGYLVAAAALLSVAGVQMGAPPRSSWLSLAGTAGWLTGTEHVPDGAPARTPDPTGHLVTLPGADSPVTVVGPPGRVGERRAAWSSTTELGRDAAQFRGP